MDLPISLFIVSPTLSIVAWPWLPLEAVGFAPGNGVSQNVVNMCPFLAYELRNPVQQVHVGLQVSTYTSSAAQGGGGSFRIGNL